MPKTINAYISDLGEVEVSLSAGNVAAVAAFTTAESIIIDGTVRTFQRTNSPKKASSRTNVTGDTTPIVLRSSRIQEEELWELVLVDDYFSGAAGEWGTDDLSAVEIFYELLANNGSASALPWPSRREKPTSWTRRRLRIGERCRSTSDYLARTPAEHMPEFLHWIFECTDYRKALRMYEGGQLAVWTIPLARGRVMVFESSRVQGAVEYTVPRGSTCVAVRGDAE